MGKPLDAETLKERVCDPGFTPSVRDAPGLLELLLGADEARVRDVERAIGRLGAAGLPALTARFGRSGPDERARLVRAAGRLAAAGPEASSFLIAALADEDARTRRYAAVALGKLAKGTPGVEAALVGAWDRETRDDVRRAIADALGKAGTKEALERLRAHAGEDARLAEVAARARLFIERDEARARSPGAIDASRAPEAPVPVILRCRAGLERIVAGEIPERCGADLVLAGEPSPGSGLVRAELRGPLGTLFRVRTLESFALDLGARPASSRAEVTQALVEVMTSERARALVERWTSGPPRYRIAWGGGGHRRADVYRAAEAIARARPSWINDPKASLWELVAHESKGRVTFELSPRALKDPRFAYRVREVPAASHPPLAAALVRVAGVRADDVVWDPFVGAGTELVERALAGPYARLHGGDVDLRAVDAARANLAAAEVSRAEVACADARQGPPGPVTLVLTNPPMGRRVVRRAELGPLLDRVVQVASRALAPGGRMVWVSPLGARTAACARAEGMRVSHVCEVDLGGFSAALQRFDRPAGAPVTRSRGSSAARPARTPPSRRR